MELWLIWIVAGFTLVIAELLTGTFYLLVIGLGAFAGAVAAWMGAGVLLQAVAGSVVAIAGAVFVHHWHTAQRGKGGGKSNNLDLGQPVVLESWANEAAGIARVKYRGTSWDARLVQHGRPPPGATLYIDAMEGSTLVVVSAPPSN